MMLRHINEIFDAPKAHLLNAQISAYYSFKKLEPEQTLPKGFSEATSGDFCTVGYQGEDVQFSFVPLEAYPLYARGYFHAIVGYASSQSMARRMMAENPLDIIAIGLQPMLVDGSSLSSLNQTLLERLNQLGPILGYQSYAQI